MHFAPLMVVEYNIILLLSSYDHRPFINESWTVPYRFKCTTESLLYSMSLTARVAYYEWWPMGARTRQQQRHDNNIIITIMYYNRYAAYLSCFFLCNTLIVVILVTIILLYCRPIEAVTNQHYPRLRVVENN